jgi:inositol-phosphate phosphatase / L-galactose 1-phosphate phosphatase / histidinol-phosphatase
VNNDLNTDLTTFATELADAARTVTLRYFRRPLDIEHKTDTSPVTIADRETEQLLRQRILQRFPEHGLYGEEYGQHGLEQRHRWVIDPIDGTKSFICGVPTFGTLIALLDGSESIIGVIDMPALDERWVGTAGQPTRFNGEPCRTRDCSGLADAALFATAPEMFQGEDAQRFQRLVRRVRLRRFGGDCHAYGLLAAGFIDLVVEADLKPYDFMALIPVIRGAGGVISDWRGQPLGLGSDGRVLAAATPELHERALVVLNAD